MSERGEDGSQYRDHLKAKAKKNDPWAVAELARAPEVPQGMEDIWSHFLWLHARRRIGQFGVEAITPEAIDAANRLLGWDLLPEEADAIARVDVAYRSPNQKPEETEVQRPAWPEQKE